ncbi:MAG: hypothetical protein J3Q66DRAFT_347859, partial [Benniella sp.]
MLLDQRPLLQHLLNLSRVPRVHSAILGCLLLQRVVLFLQPLDLCLILRIVLDHDLHLLLLVLHKYLSVHLIPLAVYVNVEKEASFSSWNFLFKRL